MEILQQPNESVLINSKNTNNEEPNEFQCEKQSCIFHPNEKIIYLNTNLNDKRILACYLCITSEGLNSKQLLPLIHLNNNDEIFKVLWGCSENLEVLENYNSVKSFNLNESKEDILKQTKVIRDTLNSQLDQLESQLLFENDLKYSLLLNLKSTIAQFAEKTKNQINLNETNNQIVENNLRGLLLGIQQMKVSFEEQAKLLKSLDISKYQKQIKQLLCDNLKKKLLELKEDNQKHEKMLLTFFNKSSQISGDVLSKINPILKDSNVVYEKESIITCKQCNQTTMETKYKIPYLSIPDVTLERNLKCKLITQDNVQKELKLANIPFTHGDIIQAARFQFQVSQNQRLITEVNGQIIHPSEIIDNSTVKSLNVYKVTYDGKEEENILIKIHFCKKNNLPIVNGQTNGLMNTMDSQQQQQSQVSQQQQPNSIQQPEQNQQDTKEQNVVSILPNNDLCKYVYLSINKNIKESDLVNKIVSQLLRYFSFKDQRPLSKMFYTSSNQEQLWNIPQFGMHFIIKLESDKQLDEQGQETLFSTFTQDSIPKIFVNFIEEQFNQYEEHLEESFPSLIFQNTVPISFIEAWIKNNNLQFKEKSNLLYCCNCSKIQSQEQKDNYSIENQETLIFDYSNIHKCFVSNNIRFSYNTMQIKHTNKVFKLKHIIGIIDDKYQQISYDSTIDHWTIGDEIQTTLEKQKLDSMNPLLVVYQKQTQENINIE